MGNIRRLVLLVILLEAILVTGCGTINLELNASGGGNLPSFEIKAKLEFRDFAKAHILMDATGEQNAREIAADTFKRWKIPILPQLLK